MFQVAASVLGFIQARQHAFSVVSGSKLATWACMDASTPGKHVLLLTVCSRGHAHDRHGSAVKHATRLAALVAKEDTNPVMDSI